MAYLTCEFQSKSLFKVEYSDTLLDESQIQDFLRRHTDEAIAAELYDAALKFGTGLARIPLFLRMIVDLCRESPVRTPNLVIINSRSGIVAHYAKYLLTRDDRNALRSPDVFALAELTRALNAIAELAESTGLSLPLGQAAAVLKNVDNDRARVGEIINALAGKGILVLEGDYLRFWHHTLQEHFYAGALVARWRGSAVTLTRIPRLGRATIAAHGQEESLSHLIAHLEPDELEIVFSAALRGNLNLCIRWADDFTSEERQLPYVQRTVATCARRVKRLRWIGAFERFQKFISRPRYIWWQVIGCMVLGGLAVVLVSLHLLAAAIRFACSGQISNTRVNLLAALMTVRAQSLRAQLTVLLTPLFAEEEESSFERLRLQRKEDSQYVEDEISSLFVDDDDMFVRLRYFEIVPVDPALGFLEKLVELNNAYSRRAMDVLAIRADRFSQERPEILRLAIRVYDDPAADFILRGRARKLLNKYGPRVSLWRDVNERLARRWALRTVALILGGIGLGICGFILRVTERMGYNESLVRVIILSMIAIIVMYDAQRIGARRIKGCFYWDSLSPVYYSVLVLFFTAIALPAYCLARRRIARNSTRIMPGFK